MKSKYVESYINDTYKEVKDELCSGRLVLFCGTPCQISGLIKVLNKRFENLITCDFVCHGVPSGKLLKDHLQYIHKDEKLLGLDFRPKDMGWTSKYIRLVTKTNTRTRSKHYNFDTYYKGFMVENAFLRKSCYHCKFHDNHFSDITMADFWKYFNFNKSLNDEKGISLMIAHTDQGLSIVEGIKANGFSTQQIDFKYAEYVYNRKDYEAYEKVRESFYREYDKNGFEKAAKKTYMKNVAFKYSLYKVKQIVKNTIGKK